MSSLHSPTIASPLLYTQFKLLKLAWLLGTVSSFPRKHMYYKERINSAHTYTRPQLILEIFECDKNTMRMSGIRKTLPSENPPFEKYKKIYSGWAGGSGGVTGWGWSAMVRRPWSLVPRGFQLARRPGAGRLRLRWRGGGRVGWPREIEPSKNAGLVSRSSSNAPNLSWSRPDFAAPRITHNCTYLVWVLV